MNQIKMLERILANSNRVNSRFLDENKIRFEWVTICKGILILSVVVGHTMGILSPYVYLYHIPAFFFLAGYVERLEEKSMLQIVVQKFCSLLVPFIFTNIIFLFIRVGLNLFGCQQLFYSEKFTITDVFHYVMLILKGEWITDLGGTTWYLLCLFVTFLVAKLIVISTRNRVNWLTLLIALAIYYIGTFFATNKVTVKFYIDIAFVAVFYLIFGNFCRKKNILDRLTYVNWKVWGILFVLYGLIFYNGFRATVDWAARKYGNPILSMVSILFAIIILMNLSKSLQDTRMGEKLKFYGEKSLPLMLIHFFILKIVYVILVLPGIYSQDILKNLTPSNMGFANVLYLIAVLLIFRFLDFIFSENFIYKNIFEGKIKISKKVREGKYNNYSAIVTLTVLCFIIVKIPFNTITDKINALIDGYSVEGVYDDNFIGKELLIQLDLENETIIQFQLYKVYEKNNYCDIYIDDKYLTSYEICEDLTAIKIPIEDTGISTVRVEFRETVTPIERGDTNDSRELSVILVNGEISLMDNAMI